jgi:hypothetical protein
LHLFQEANINAVLTEELVQFQNPALQQASRKPFPPFLVRCTEILSDKKDSGFEDSSRASFPYWKCRGHGEKAVRELFGGRLTGRSTMPSSGD